MLTELRIDHEIINAMSLWYKGHLGGIEQLPWEDEY
jgi:hypothetical protein